MTESAVLYIWTYEIKSKLLQPVFDFFSNTLFSNFNPTGNTFSKYL